MRAFVALSASLTLLTGMTALGMDTALADHVTEPGSPEADCTYTSEDGNTAVGAEGVFVYAGPNSSDPDDGSDRVAAGTCLDDNDVYEGTNEVALDTETLYVHVASDGGEGNNEALFDGWFGVWSCGGGETPELLDGIEGNWHDDENAPCKDGGDDNGSAPPATPECDRGSEEAGEHAQRPRCEDGGDEGDGDDEGDDGLTGSNECPPAELDPSDNAFSVQSPVGAACVDLTDQSCAHIWADVNDVDPAPGPYMSFGNDHPSNEEGCEDPSDEPDDGRSADNGLCVGTDEGPDSGSDTVECANPGDTIDEFGISLGSEVDECRRFVTGEDSNPDHGSVGVCADDDGDGVPDPEAPTLPEDTAPGSTAPGL